MSSLYIHIPFCEKKCFYCSFVVAIAQEQHVDSYLTCLEKEAAQHKGKKIKTIFVGGGTPTFMSCDQLKRLFKIIKSIFNYSKECEITIEANPEGLDTQKAKLLFELGTTRVSLGVQSFHDHYLKFLGRCHTAKNAVDTFNTLRKAGFKNINVDLMYSFPDQSCNDIEEDVNRLSELNCEHVSLYSLTVDPNSRFYAKKLKQQSKEQQAKQYEYVTDALEQSGFRQYEISNFSKSGKESQHNLNYWLGGDYVGLGVGAHSHFKGKRSWNSSRLKEYMALIEGGKDSVEGSEHLGPQERLRETLLLGLRMNAGVDLEKIEGRFKCQLANDKKNKIDDFIEGDLLAWNGNNLKATLRGKLVLDEIAAYLI